MRTHRALELVFEREGARRGVTFGLSALTRLYVDGFTQEWQEAGQIVARELIFKQYYRETIGKGPTVSDVRDLFQDLKLRSATPDETLRRLLVHLKDAEIKENGLRSEEAKKAGEKPHSTAFWSAVEDPKLMCYHPKAPYSVVYTAATAQEGGSSV